MANSLISMIKGNSTLINNTEVLNGQVLFDTDKKAILLDDNNTRSEYCGADKSNKNLAPIENGNTATRGYSAGSYVVWKGQLYKVLTQINSGTAFVVGTNIVADTVGAELTQINNDLDSRAAIISTKTVVPSDNNDAVIDYPAGTSYFSTFIGYKVKISDITFQEAPVPGLSFYSNLNYFQIHAYGIDSQYVGKEIWLYFILDQ